MHLCSGSCTLSFQYQSNNWWIWNMSHAGTLKYCSCSLSDRILTHLLLYLQHFLCHVTIVLSCLFCARGFECENFWNHVLMSCDCRSPVKTASSFHPIIHLLMCTRIKKIKQLWKYFHWFGLVWFGLVYLFIHSVTYVTLDSSPVLNWFISWDVFLMLVWRWSKAVIPK